jgi:hypothetical protein
LKCLWLIKEVFFTLCETGNYLHEFFYTHEGWKNIIEIEATIINILAGGGEIE